jgi:hypothetical protein
MPITELSPEAKAELESLGVPNVLKKLDQAGIGRGSLVRGFDCGEIQRSVIEDWIAAKDQETVRQQQKILLWARIAGLAAIGGIIVSVFLWFASR